MKKALAVALILPALVLLTGCPEPPPEDFGTVMIELQRSEGEADDPFQGTKIITAFLDYEASCLAPFYTTDHPEYQQDGIEGAPVFEEWGVGGRLCDSDYDKPIPKCSIGEDGMRQTIDTQGAQDITRLVIDYQIADDDIEGTISRSARCLPSIWPAVVRS